MKKSKANIICMVICIVVALALVGGAVVGVLSNSNNEGNNPNTEEIPSNNNQNTAETDGNKESESTESDLTDIPSIRDDPKLSDVQGKPSIDVGEMTKNPEAEVVGSKVEYGTKESGTNAE